MTLTRPEQYDRLTEEFGYSNSQAVDICNFFSSEKVCEFIEHLEWERDAI